MVEEKISMDHVRFFRGPKELYEDTVGYEVKVIDMGDRNFGVRFNNYDMRGRYICSENYDRQVKLQEGRIEALVECEFIREEPSHRVKMIIGLPVMRREE